MIGKTLKKRPHGKENRDCMNQHFDMIDLSFILNTWSRTEGLGYRLLLYHPPYRLTSTFTSKPLDLTENMNILAMTVSYPITVPTRARDRKFALAKHSDGSTVTFTCDTTKGGRMTNAFRSVYIWFNMEKRRRSTLERSTPGTWLYFPYFSNYTMSLMPKNAILQYKTKTVFCDATQGVLG